MSESVTPQTGELWTGSGMPKSAGRKVPGQNSVGQKVPGQNSVGQKVPGRNAVGRKPRAGKL